MVKRAKIPKKYRDLELEKQYEEARIERIYQEVKAKTRLRQVNKMIGTLKKAGYDKESLAIKNIINKLESTPMGIGKTKSGYINLRRVTNLNETQLTGINISIDQFLKNRTSTIEGFEELYEERRQELKNMFDDKNFIDNLTREELRDIYSVFQSNAYTRNQKKFDSKTFFTVYTNAIDKKWDRQKFIKEMELYIDTGSDADLKDSIVEIYEHIKKYTYR